MPDDELRNAISDSVSMLLSLADWLENPQPSPFCHDLPGLVAATLRITACVVEGSPSKEVPMILN